MRHSLCVCGLRATVSLARSTHSDVDVLSIDAHTRVLAPEVAAARVRDWIGRHANNPSILLFKKIDSTLRGHLAIELATALEARRKIVPETVAIMAPAFPANGRTTVGGMHYVDGCPLHETELWKREGIRGEARIAAMIEGSGLKCALVDLSIVRGPRTTLNATMERIAASADVLICDAEREEDLAAIAAVAASLGTGATSDRVVLLASNESGVRRGFWDHQRPSHKV